MPLSLFIHFKIKCFETQKNSKIADISTDNAFKKNI
jgi:hypothetical protein